MSKNNDNDLFYQEKVIHSEVKKLCNDQQFADNPLLNHIKELLFNYQKLLRMTEKLVKISDYNERKLLESEKKFRSVTQSAHDAIISANSKGTIISWNRGAKNTFGYEEDEVIGKSIGILIPESHREAHIKAFEQAGLSNKIINTAVEWNGLKKDGSEFPTEISLASWKVEEDIFFSAIIRDVTERKRIERLRQDTEHIVRHDLKNPLSGIISFSELLLMDHDVTEEDLKQYLYKINDSAYKMIQLLNQSFDLFQMEEGAYKLKPQKFDFIKMLKGLGKQFKIYQEYKSMGIIYFAGDRPFMENETYPILGEEVYIESLMANLIKNAFEAAPNGSDVCITISREDDFHFINIHNDGSIPKEIRDSFFERYVTSGKERGTGIGTYSAMLIAKTHGGGISFTSSDENGTNIIVKLPVHISAL